MRPHILLLTTGGTIASLPTAEGLAPGLDGEALAGLLPQGIMDCYDITIRDILHLDSSNIQPEEWQTIARHVFENRMEYSGIVITHGTDTMAYTASVLSFMLRGISIPVVLTGAQLPMAHPLSDGMENLRTALAMAASGVPGVFLAFDRKVILGCRAVKTRTTDFDAFESVNWPLAANVDGKGLQIHREAIPAPAGACALRDKLCDKVFLIKLTPGLDPEIFDMLLQMHYRGIVIEAFGAGGLHFVRRDLIAKLQAAARAGMTVVVCSQCLYEPSDFSVYEVGQRALAQAHKAAAVGVQLHGVLTQQHPARGDGVAPLLKIQIPAEAVHDGQLRPQGGGQGGDGAHQPLGVEAPLLPVGQAALAVF